MTINSVTDSSMKFDRMSLCRMSFGRKEIDEIK